MAFLYELNETGIFKNLMNFKLKVKVKKTIDTPEGKYPYTLGYVGILD